MVLKAGDVFTWTRTFTDEEILQFAELTGDKGEHHMSRDEHGRLMVHGLLTSSIATKIGGDLNYIARNMNFEYVRPVFSGDTITCEITITDIEQRDTYKKLSMKSIFRNQDGKEVLTGTSHGIIKD
ncbi:acyl dehydratase [Melghiribacillus thermohalophilus]|uniref:Acyl dehydratase n=1 Tax=Melghiribacillus thermohalophilus TaxID=1324956 RepID=A0A4R3MRC5_9BACI|nr:MaoC family dehydratase [Melghiribacillus thermohalophilus]TCT18050.1 acyl dehydratase [Melghiribacillus thermohalophilus]